jgi:DNA-binding MarR family transcriptional regulator
VKQILPPMPTRVFAIQRMYFDLLKEVEHITFAYSINAQQALMLAHIGDEELSPREIIRKRYYTGSNATYNLNNLTEAGFVTRAAAKFDRRKVLISLTPKGREVAEQVREALAERVREVA